MAALRRRKARRWQIKPDLSIPKPQLHRLPCAATEAQHCAADA
jgi:hypothetical protein